LSDESDDLQKIREEKLEELKEKKLDEDQIEEQKEQREAQKKKILRQILTTKARQRLANLRMARPQFTESIEQQLILLAQQGRVQGKIDDEKLKEILKKLKEDDEEINIIRK